MPVVNSGPEFAVPDPTNIITQYQWMNASGQTALGIGTVTANAPIAGMTRIAMTVAENTVVGLLTVQPLDALSAPVGEAQIFDVFT